MYMRLIATRVALVMVFAPWCECAPRHGHGRIIRIGFTSQAIAVVLFGRSTSRFNLVSFRIAVSTANRIGVVRVASSELGPEYSS